MTTSPKHVVLGTAGHIDHGKTELVKTLTGVDTDRLAEEKARGISIELGFARLGLPSGAVAGIVDVPGHERFVRTMLAGVGGIDLILMVVAADEGVMPQTREHLEIVDLLGVERGVVAITKTDLVRDDGEIDLVREEVEELVAGTGLAGAPIVPVSVVSGDGVDELLAALDAVVSEVRGRSAEGPARLPVDRVFTLEGHGTIVTGTLRSGRIAPGDRLEMHPGGGTTRVRSVQVHDRAVEAAVAGERTALGLHGVSKADLVRGSTLGTPGTLHETHMFDARLRLVPAAKPLRNRTRVHLHSGTAEVLARIVLLEGETIAPGSDALVQFRLESPLVAEVGDLFVIRSYSPVTTIGGGRVIDPAPRKHRRMREDIIEEIEVLEAGSAEEVALALATEAGAGGTTREDLTARAGDEAAEAVETLLAGGRLVRIGGALLAAEVYGGIRRRALEVLESFAAASPLEWGMSAEELRAKVARRLDRPVLESALRDLESEGAVTRRGGLVRRGGAAVEMTSEQDRVAAAIEARLLESGPSPPSLPDLRNEIPSKEFDGIVKLLASEGRVVKVTSQLFFHPDVIEGIRSAVAEHFAREDELGVAAFKDLLGITRKHAIPILEFLDREGTTIRSGNVRRRGRRAG